MSTVTPVHIDEADAYNKASLDGAIAGIADGLNALEDDDFADDAFGVETTLPIVADYLTTKRIETNVGVVATAVATAYPGAGVDAGWTAVVRDGIDIVLTASTAFEVGPASPQKITGVLVGAMWDVTGTGHLVLGVKHTGDIAVLPVHATDLIPIDFGSEGIYAVEYMITEADVPPGETLEEIWLLASGTLSIRNGQLWALPLHGA